MTRPAYPVANSPWEELPKQSMSAPLLAQLGLSLGVQYVAVRLPPGPRSAGLNPAAALVASPLCQIPAEGKALLLLLLLLEAFRGLAHSARLVPDI